MFAAGKSTRRAGTAISVVSTFSDNSNADNNKLNLDRPSGATVGDVLLAMAVLENQSATWTATGAWTTVYSSSGVPAVLVAVRTLSAADASINTFSFQASVSTRHVGGSIVAIRNGAFVSAGPVTENAATPTTLTAAAVQSDKSNSMLFTLYAHSNNNAANPYGTPTDMSSVASDPDTTNRPQWGIFNQIVGAASYSKILSASAGTSGASLAINLIFGPA